MPKYSDEEIRKFEKITLKIAGDYLGIQGQGSDLRSKEAIKTSFNYLKASGNQING